MNYYNEWDKATAAWLQELMERGLIPKGHIDTRSIADVHPSDLAGYVQHHFFCGIGGWPLALDLAGWPRDRPVWTGSCPCQPFSAAGKQKGGADDRHVWPEFFRLIQECRPDAIIGEQVEGAVGHGWLDGVFGDLEGEGYTCWAAVLGAHSSGAPHIRQRLYWVADGGHEYGRGWTEPDVEEWTKAANSSDMGQPFTEGLQRPHGNDKPPARVQCQFTESGPDGGLPHAGCAGPSEQRGEWHEPEGLAAPVYAGGVSNDAIIGRKVAIFDGSDGNKAIGERQADVCGSGSMSSNFWSNFDILPFIDGKARRVESGTFPLVDGLPRGVVPSCDISESYAQATSEARVMRLKGYGNAIVPQVAAEFIGAYMDIMRNNNERTTA